MIDRCFRISLILLVLVGCTKNESKNLDLRVHLPKVQIHLDPHKMEDAYSMMINSQLYRGLLRFNPTGDVVPDLATSWSESADRKTYKFKIRSSTFSNGEKITAKHIQLSFARLFLLQAAMAADIDYIKGADQLIKTKDLSKFGVRPISADEVEFELSFPTALFLKHIAVADCAILPLSSLEEISNEPKAYSGPYRLENNNDDGTFNLVKWRHDSLESRVPPRKISFFVSDENPVKLAEQGKTDSLDRDPLTEAKKTELRNQGWGMSPTELTGETFLILNPKFLSKELREYLYLKTNPAQIVELLREPQFKPAFGLIPVGFPGELSAEEVAGLRKVDPKYRGKRTTLLVDFDPSSDVEKKIADSLKETWTTDRMTVQLNPLSKAQKLERMFSKTSEVVIGRKGIDYPDGFSVLTYFKGKYSSNYFHVNDPTIDEAIETTAREFDPTKRSALYKDIQRQILKHHTIVPILFGSQASGLWSQKLKVVPSHPMGYHTMHFETMEMKN